MPIRTLESTLPWVNDKIKALESTKDYEKKRYMFIWILSVVEIYTKTFYIDYPGTKQAERLYQIASEFATQLNDGNPVTNGDIWKILMPQLNNTETACRFPLPGYDERQSLILTSNGTHLLSIPEMSQTCDSDPSLDGLPNLHGDCGLTVSEQSQVREKDYDLWCKYYNRGEPWLSQQTFEKLVFMLNMALSSKDDIDGNFEFKFEGSLLEDTNFKKFYQQNFQKTALSLGGYNGKEVKLTCCYKYFEFYLKTLPKSEQSAFKLVQLKNRNLYETVISINTGSTCMTMAAYNVSDFAFALTSEKNREKWKYDLINKRHIWNHDIIGTLQHLVKEPQCTAENVREEKSSDSQVTSTPDTTSSESELEQKTLSPTSDPSFFASSTANPSLSQQQLQQSNAQDAKPLKVRFCSIL